MIIPIKSFNQIDIIPDSLVILDIDETVLTYPQLTKNWWKEKINYYYKITNDLDLSEKHALSEWINIVQTTNPKKLDSKEQNNFINKLYQNNCQLIFLTARNKDLSEITYKNLSYIGINKAHSVYFDENKGEKIYELISEFYTNVENIIFVDDLTNNHNKILDTVKKYNIKINFKLYQIDHDY
jgi:ABC-type proline/glycine betaine transport system ATPase subunit